MRWTEGRPSRELISQPGAAQRESTYAALDLGRCQRAIKGEVYHALLYRAVGLVFALAVGPAAFAENGWDTSSNGYGYYHQSNG